MHRHRRSACFTMGYARRQSEALLDRLLVCTLAWGMDPIVDPSKISLHGICTIAAEAGVPKLAPLPFI